MGVEETRERQNKTNFISSQLCTVSQKQISLLIYHVARLFHKVSCEKTGSATKVTYAPISIFLYLPL